MKTLRTIAFLVRADFLERVRRYSFLLTMVAGIYLGYAVNTGSVVIHLEKYRCLYNSAFIGTFVALSAAVFISLIGFYVVKNAINRDRQTRVGQILAATPLSKFLYLLGKSISNFGVLAAIVAIQAAAAIVMRILSKENPDLDFAALLLPFVLITLPAVAFVAAGAILFESVRWLRGGFGNVIYFLVVQMLMVISIEGHLPGLDLWSVQEIEVSMGAAAKARYPEYKGGFVLNAGPKEPIDKFNTFQWDGMQWTAALVEQRLAWIGYAFLTALIAASFFDRFDDSRTRKRKRGFWRRESVEEPAMTKTNGTASSWMKGLLPRILSIQISSRFGHLVQAELRLMMKGVHWAWYLVAFALVIISIFAPSDAVKTYLIPCTWIWPVLMWSKMGMRESWYGTGQLLFSAPHVHDRQLIAVWTSGVLLALIISIGGAVRLLSVGDWNALIGLFGGIVFVPSLSLAFGVWSGGSKFFEAVYTVWWYIGPINHTAELDFTGASSSPGIALAYLVASLVLFGAAYLGRQREMAV